jgi:hypothetical protein
MVYVTTRTTEYRTINAIINLHYMIANGTNNQTSKRRHLACFTDRGEQLLNNHFRHPAYRDTCISMYIVLVLTAYEQQIMAPALSALPISL